MATDPRVRRRRTRRLSRRRTATDGGTWWRRLRRPLLHLVLAVVCLPVVVLLADGRPVLATLVAVAAAVAVALDVRAVLRQDRRRHAAQEYAERVLECACEDWIRAEAARGHVELERWRRTHRL